MEDVWKSFGEKKVIKGVTLEALEGQLYCLIGPNGSGKTTLLKIADMLEVPDSGKIYFDGVELLGLDHAKRIQYIRRMAMVFQHPILYNASVYDNISIGLRIRGLSRSEIEDRVKRVLNEVNLYDYRNKHAYTLSGGEAQRLCLARALALEPKVLFLDEPTANLDPANKYAIERMVKDYCIKNKAIVIFTTHDMLEAKRLADKVGLLLDGKIVEEGSVQDFFTRTKNELVANFLGGELTL
jgi:tungstate transport system ATP-binding protein